MAKKPPKPGSGSFWTSIPGLLTTLTGVITAATGFATVVYPRVQASLVDPDVIPIKDFAKRTVLERGTYRVQSGGEFITVSVDDIKVQKGIVFLEISVTGQRGTKIQLTPEKPQVAVVGSKEYLITVHDLADVLIGADTAQLTIAPR